MTNKDARDKNPCEFLIQETKSIVLIQHNCFIKYLKYTFHTKFVF